MITIDPNSILSSFNDKCTLLQAITSLNNKIETMNVVYEHNLFVLLIKENGSQEAVIVKIYNLNNNKMSTEDFKKYLTKRAFGTGCTAVPSVNGLKNIPFSLFSNVQGEQNVSYISYDSVRNELTTKTEKIVNLGVNDTVFAMGGVNE